MKIRNQFAVTFEIVTPESAEHRDADEIGYVCENETLREAAKHIGESAHEADSSPFSRMNPPRWLTHYKWNEDYATGAEESRTLHIPRGITPSSAMRIARLLGVNAR